MDKICDIRVAKRVQGGTRREWFSRFLFLTFAVVFGGAVVGSVAAIGIPALAAEPITNVGSDEPILLEADDVSYDTNAEVVTARGNVQAVQGGAVLLADEVVYYRNEDRVVARGNVSLTDEDGNTYFGDDATLSNHFQNGLINSFSALLDQSSRVAAAQAERIDGKRHLLRKGVFSSCPVCEKEDGTSSKPTWQIKAVRVVQDQEALKVSYRDLIMEVKGVPVFYFPYFSHPDPSVKRKSGFLFPTIGTSDRLGTIVEVPYFFALAPNYDLTLSPLITGDEGMVMKSEWRHRTPFGDYELSGSLTSSKDRTDTNIQTNNRETYGHMFGEGRFKATKHSSAGFQYEATNDDTYLRRYNITNNVDLESNAYFERIHNRNYAFISSHYFQGLRATDNPGLTPYILPRIKAHYTMNPGGFGRINFDGDALVLQRSEGVDSRRLSASADWQKTFTSSWGLVTKPFVHLRGDVYHSNDRYLGGGGSDKFTSRFLPSTGIDWRMPFARQGTRATIIVEPIVQTIFAPNGGNPDSISNEDSETLVFDATSLFFANKSPGLDRWEDGSRVNAGFKVGGYLANGRFAQVTFGRNFRLKETDAFGLGSGLGETASDYVGRIEIEPVPWFNFSQNMRFDSDSLAFKLNEIRASVNWWRVRAQSTYLNVDNVNELAELPAREEVKLLGQFRITDNWSTFAGTRRDLLEGQPLETNIGLEYVDDCTRFTMAFRRSFFRDRDIQPSDTLLFNIVLNGLGGFGSSGN